MIILKHGHSYTVETANKFPAVQITFCTKENGVFVDGITNEELVTVLIDRMNFLNDKKPTTENLNVLTHLQQAHHWMHARNYKKISNQKANSRRHDNRRDDIHIHTEGRQTGQQEVNQLAQAGNSVSS